MPTDSVTETHVNKTIDGQFNTISGIGTGSLVDGAVTTVKIADDAVTNAKLANMAQATIKGRASGAGTGDPTDLTGAQASLIILGREFLLADRIVYVRDDATGDTSRDGSTFTTASAFQTWQAAIEWFDNNCFANGYQPIFTQVLPSVDASVSFPHDYSVAGLLISIAKRPTGGNSRTFVFGTGNDDDVRLESTSGGAVISLGGDFGSVIFTNKARLRGVGLHIVNGGHGKVFYNGTFLHQNNGGSVMYQNQQEGSYLSVGSTGKMKIDDNCENPIRNDSGVMHFNGQVDIVGARTFTVGLLRADFWSKTYFQNNANGGISGSFTGPRFRLRMQSAVEWESAQPIPGNSRGSAEPGCSVTMDQVDENVQRGTATFPGGGPTTVVVTIPVAQFGGTGGTNYDVTIKPRANRTYWVTGQTATQFTINQSATAAETVGWELAWF